MSSEPSTYLGSYDNLSTWLVPSDLYTSYQSGDSSELAPRLPYKGKSVRNRGVSQTMPFLVIPRSLLRGGFINMLAVILGYTELALAALPPDSLLGHHLRHVRAAGERARGLVQ